MEGGGKSRGIRLAIYDVPAKVGRALSDELGKAGHTVLFEGLLTKETARNDADVWINKWSFNLKEDFLAQKHPRRGIITLTNGIDHIDTKTISKLGIRLETCPTFSSQSVAEHALALALRTMHKPFPREVPPGPVAFFHYSDKFAEQAVAQVVLRSKRLEQAIGRARAYSYFDADGRRPSGPWELPELSALRIGIMGKDRKATRLAKMLKEGFGCQLMGDDVGAFMRPYAVRQVSLAKLLRDSDYLFMCTDKNGTLNLPATVVSPSLVTPKRRLAGSKVAVLGTGNIGSIIANTARLGFGCDVSAFNTSSAPLETVIDGADFVFIALPENDSTRGIIGRKALEIMSKQPPVLVNASREAIVDSERLYSHLVAGTIRAYGTDVLPGDKKLWAGIRPDDLPADDITRRFVEHPRVVATPHDAEASMNSLERMIAEARIKIRTIMEG